MRKHDRCIPKGNTRNPCGDIFLVPMRKTAILSDVLGLGVCVRLSMYTVSRHQSPDSTPNEFIDPKWLYFLQVSKLIKTSSSHRCHILFCSCILLCLSMHPSLSLFSSLHLFLYAGPVPEPRGGLADLQLGTGRRWEMYLHRCGSSTEHV